MDFFDPTDADDLALLPPALRTSAEVAELVPVVAADLVAHYTVTVDGVPVVALVGYTATRATRPAPLQDALRRTVADVLAWRHRAARKDPLTATESGRDKSTTYRDDAAHPFPPHFDRYLLPYDVRVDTLGLV